jgi:hypothetical protein
LGRRVAVGSSFEPRDRCRTNQIAVGLEPGRHGPCDLLWRVNVDVVINHDYFLDIVMTAEAAEMMCRPAAS